MNHLIKIDRAAALAAATVGVRDRVRALLDRQGYIATVQLDEPGDVAHLVSTGRGVTAYDAEGEICGHGDTPEGAWCDLMGLAPCEACSTEGYLFGFEAGAHPDDVRETVELCGACDGDGYVTAG